MLSVSKIKQMRNMRFIIKTPHSRVLNTGVLQVYKTSHL
jgi:hypothetical protein